MEFLSENPCGQQLLIAFNLIHWSSPGSRKPSASVASLPTKIQTTFEDFMKGNSMEFPEVSQQNASELIRTHPNSSELSQLFPDNSQVSGFPQDQKPGPHFRVHAGTPFPGRGPTAVLLRSGDGIPSVRWDTLSCWEDLGWNHEGWTVKMGYATPQNGYFNGENDD